MDDRGNPTAETHLAADSGKMKQQADTLELLTESNGSSAFTGLVVSVRSSTGASETEATEGTVADVPLSKTVTVPGTVTVFDKCTAERAAAGSAPRRRRLSGFETYDIRRVREWVVAHNSVRKLHNKQDVGAKRARSVIEAQQHASGGSSLPPLLWDPALARFAQAHADSVGANAQCRPEANEAAGEAGLGEVYLWGAVEKGEALFMAKEAVEAWAEQGKHYSSSTGGCEPGKECGAFIQLTWRETRRVGCGEALCPYKGNFTGVAQFFVCNYYPPAQLSMLE
ncbi:hypothetical protein CLOM_g15836 [Closterium sp. NIES-68]|nr:hypothetical protein CLOM_g15836 [Closterium sp. NIES-68]GJP72960.1 hypothetical protein CLOP_g3727 [Closterium sp. NIES-67]